MIIWRKYICNICYKWPKILSRKIWRTTLDNVEAWRRPGAICQLLMVASPRKMMTRTWIRSVLWHIIFAHIKTHFHRGSRKYVYKLNSFPDVSTCHSYDVQWSNETLTLMQNKIIANQLLVIVRTISNKSRDKNIRPVPSRPGKKFLRTLGPGGHQAVTKWSPSGHQAVTKWSPSVRMGWKSLNVRCAYGNVFYEKSCN